MRVRGIRHPYMWGRDHPLVVDTLIAAGVMAFGVLTEYTNAQQVDADANIRDPNWFGTTLTVVSALALVARRRHPLAVWLVVTPLSLTHTFMTYPGGGPLAALLFALYAIAARPPSRRSAVGALGVVLAAATALVIVPKMDASLYDLIPIYGLVITAWIVGDNMRIRRAHIAATEERAERLERERDAEAQRAVLQERSRIAREMHDIVAHSMSVMLVQAGAARRTLGRDLRSSVEALGHIEATGRQAMAEMRRLVAVLREDDDTGSLLPQPGIEEIAVLVGHCRDAGLDVTMNATGEATPLPEGLQLVVYRIVQEALTNTMKHAGPAHATVTFEYGRDMFRLSVADDGRGAATTPTSEPGHGLAGMRERVTLYGGELHAGPQTGGGFRVSAELPLTAAGAATARPAQHAVSSSENARV